LLLHAYALRIMRRLSRCNLRLADEANDANSAHSREY